MDQKLRMVQVKLNSIARTLQGASHDSKEKHVSHQMADNFNGILDDIEKIAPQFKDGLPARISKDGAFSMMQLTNTSFLELEIYLNQLTDIITMVEEDG